MLLSYIFDGRIVLTYDYSIQLMLMNGNYALYIMGFTYNGENCVTVVCVAQVPVK